MALTLEEKKELLEELKRELNKVQKVYVETCRKNVTLPSYKHIGDTGMDIRSAEEIKILPGETIVVPTGLKMAIPEGYEIQVRPRSGLSLNTPLRIANTPGTIDSGYRDEIGVIVNNTSPAQKWNKHFNSMIDIKEDTFYWNNYTIDEKGNKPGIYTIKIGDRIAQIVLCKFETIEFVSVEQGVVKSLGINRGGGFGHTGIK